MCTLYSEQSHFHIHTQRDGLEGDWQSLRDVTSQPASMSDARDGRPRVTSFLVQVSSTMFGCGVVGSYVGHQPEITDLTFDCR